MNFVNNSRRKVNTQPPVIPQGEVVADFKQYPEALAFVDKLIKNDFPAGSIAIVGSDLRTVERIRGKVNYTRLALSGATTGAWMGLAFGLIFGGGFDASNAAAQTSTISSGISYIVMGAGAGMLFNVIRYSLSRNKRTFVSQSSVIANKYQVQVPAMLADKAREAAKTAADA